jgi:O-antigen/teichoic acid export membrane protein
LTKFIDTIIPNRQVRSLYSDVAVYGISSVFSRGLGVLTFPLLARHFSIEDFGSLDLFLIVISLIGSLAIFGQDSGLLRFYHEYKKTGKEKEIAFLSFQMQLIWSGVIFFCSFFLLFSQIGNGKLDWINLSVSILIVWCAFSEVIQANALLLMRLQSQKLLFFVFNLIKSLSLLIAAISATSILDLTLQEYFLVHATVASLLAVGGLSIIFPHVQRSSREMVTVQRKLVKYAVPMGVVVVVGSMQPMIERLIVNTELDQTSLGEYAAAAKTALIVGLPIKAFSDAFYPFIMKALSEDNAKKAARDTVGLFVLALTIFALLYNCFSFWILNLLAGEKYLSAHQTVIPLVLVHYLHGLAGFFGLGTVISGQTNYRLLIYLFSLALGTLGMLVLAPSYGITGVALAVLLGQTVKICLESIVGQKLFSIMWPKIYIFSNLIIIFTISIVAFNSEPIFALRFALGAGGVILLSSVWIIFSIKNDKYLEGEY